MGKEGKIDYIGARMGTMVEFVFFDERSFLCRTVPARKEDFSVLPTPPKFPLGYMPLL